MARPINKGGDIGAVESNAPIKSYELVVNTASDGSDGACTTENCTLREAIEEANAAATSGSTQTYTITFAPAVFSTPQVIGINQTQSFGPGLVLRGNMNIIGPGAELLSLWPGQVTESGIRQMEVASSANVSLSGMTFQYGGLFRSRAGALQNAGTLAVTGCIFKDNRSDGGAGGAILNTGNLSVRSCTITNNSARTYGLDSSGTGLERNFGGGGIYNSGTLFVKDSTISNNTASFNCLGGGIYNIGSATIESSTVADNSTATKGGGIYSRGTLTVLGNTISGNIAFNERNSADFFAGTGGGIHSNGPLVLRNSTVAANRVENDLRNSGGGVWTNGPTASIENCTITANNSGSYPAGGVFVNNGTTTISNSVIAANANNTVYPEVIARSGSDSTAVIVSGGYNFIGYASGFNAPGDRAGSYVFGTDVVALNPQLGPLTNNGGPVQTLAPLPGSPLVNAGDPNFNVSVLPYDERGTGFPRIVGGRLDIGAVETSTPASAPKPTSKSRPSRGSAGAS